VNTIIVDFFSKYVINSIDDKSFQFKRLEEPFNYTELALADFLDSEIREIILIGDKNRKDRSKEFIDKVQNKLSIKEEIKVEHRELDFQAVITKNKAYWETSSSLINLSYDSLRVFKLNANIVNII